MPTRRRALLPSCQDEHDDPVDGEDRDEEADCTDGDDEQADDVEAAIGFPAMASAPGDRVGDVTHHDRLQIVSGSFPDRFQIVSGTSLSLALHSARVSGSVSMFLVQLLPQLCRSMTCVFYTIQMQRRFCRCTGSPGRQSRSGLFLKDHH